MQIVSFSKEFPLPQFLEKIKTEHGRKEGREGGRDGGRKEGKEGRKKGRERFEEIHRGEGNVKME